MKDLKKLSIEELKTELINTESSLNQIKERLITNKKSIEDEINKKKQSYIGKVYCDGLDSFRYYYVKKIKHDEITFIICDVVKDSFLNYIELDTDSFEGFMQDVTSKCLVLEEDEKQIEKLKRHINSFSL